MKSPPISLRNKKLIAKERGKHSVASLVFKGPLSDNTMKTLPNFMLMTAGLYVDPKKEYFGHYKRPMIL